MRRIPSSTYRLQLHAGFTFDDAVEVAKYLKQLGISHVYSSPYFQAAPGSNHGYDVYIHDLPQRLHSSDPARQIIYLRADQRVPFGAFANVMDAVKQAGITNISIITQPLNEKAGGGAK